MSHKRLQCKSEQATATARQKAISQHISS
uniref:Uncharacterized protein n=1 Tax=Anguilla anguilla TaxID=7936 RepID=A0A0E9S2N2_ANGAN